MRHCFGYRKLNKKSSARKSLLKNLAQELILNGKIVTTLERAKELRKFVEPLCTLSKTENLANTRLVTSRLYSKEAVIKLFKDIGPAVTDRPGGYTQIIRVGIRPGDHASKARNR